MANYKAGNSEKVDIDVGARRLGTLAGSIAIIITGSAGGFLPVWGQLASTPIAGIVAGSTIFGAIHDYRQHRDIRNQIRRTNFIHEIENNSSDKQKMLEEAENHELANKLGRFLYNPIKDRDIVKYNSVAKNFKQGFKWLARNLNLAENAIVALIPLDKLKSSIEADKNNRDKVNKGLKSLTKENNEFLLRMGGNHGLEKASNRYLKKVAQRSRIENFVAKEFLDDEKLNPGKYDGVSDKDLQRKFNDRVDELIKKERSLNKSFWKGFKNFFKDIKDSNTTSISSDPELYDEAVKLAENGKPRGQVITNDPQILVQHEVGLNRQRARANEAFNIDRSELPRINSTASNTITPSIRKVTDKLNKEPDRYRDSNPYDSKKNLSRRDKY